MHSKMDIARQEGMEKLHTCINDQGAVANSDAAGTLCPLPARHQKCISLWYEMGDRATQPLSLGFAMRWKDRQRLFVRLLLQSKVLKASQVLPESH